MCLAGTLFGCTQTPRQPADTIQKITWPEQNTPTVDSAFNSPRFVLIDISNPSARSYRNDLTTTLNSSRPLLRHEIVSSEKQDQNGSNQSKKRCRYNLQKRSPELFKTKHTHPFCSNVISGLYMISAPRHATVLRHSNRTPHCIAPPELLPLSRRIRPRRYAPFAIAYPQHGSRHLSTYGADRF